MPYRMLARRLRNLGTAATALIHGFLATIGLFGRLEYTVPSRYEFIEEIAAQSIWVPIHAIMMVALFAGFLHGRPKPSGVTHVDSVESKLCSASAGLMGIWGVFNLLWGLTSVHPVSLAAPGLAIFVSVGAHVLAQSWAWEWNVPNEG